MGGLAFSGLMKPKSCSMHFDGRQKSSLSVALRHLTDTLKDHISIKTSNSLTVLKLFHGLKKTHCYHKTLQLINIMYKVNNV